MTEATDHPESPPSGAPDPDAEFADLDAREALFTGALQQSMRVVNAAEAVRLQVMVAGFEAMLLEEEEQTGLIPRPDDPVVRGFLLHQANELLTSRFDVERRIEAARILRDRLPLTWAVFLDGLAAERAVVVAAQQSMGLVADDHYATFDARAAELVQVERPSAVERQLADLRDTLDPAAAAQRHVSASNRRYVRARPTGDGQGVLEIHAPAVDVAAAYDRIRKHAVEAHGRDGECRTLGNLMVDTALDAILTGRMRGAAEGGPSFPAERLGETDDPTRVLIDATVMVVVPAATATGVGDQPGQVAGMGLVDPATVQAVIAHTSSWTRVLVDPVDDAVVGIDSHERYIPAGLKRLLQYRQPTCGCGCGLPAHRADIDHVIRFEHDGRTRHDNLQVLCRSAHQAKDAGWADVRMHPDGTITWRDKWGGRRTVKPAARIRTERPVPDAVPF